MLRIPSVLVIATCDLVGVTFGFKDLMSKKGICFCLGPKTSKKSQFGEKVAQFRKQKNGRIRPPVGKLNPFSAHLVVSSCCFERFSIKNSAKFNPYYICDS